MKYLIFLGLIGLTSFIIPQALSASENLFNGTATFERLPTTISPNSTTQFEIKFQYTEGAYSLSNVTAIVDITPHNAASKVHFDAVPVNIDQNSIARIPVTITIDKAISHEKIFLSVTYVGTDLYDNLWKSAWGNTITLDIAPKEKSFPPCTSYREACFYQDEYTCDPAGWECENTKDIFSKVINSPLKQVKSGISFLEIKCKENLELIYKNNGSSVCVKPETKTKLIKRGWELRHILIK